MSQTLKEVQGLQDCCEDSNLNPLQLSSDYKKPNIVLVAIDCCGAVVTEAMCASNSPALCDSAMAESEPVSMPNTTAPMLVPACATQTRAWTYGRQLCGRARPEHRAERAALLTEQLRENGK